MHLPGWLKLLPKHLRNATLELVRWNKNQLAQIANALLVFVVLTVLLTAIGIFWAKMAYNPNTPFDFQNGGVAFGELLIGLAGAISGFLWLYIMVRVGIVTGVATAISGAVPPIVKQVSRPLPSTPIELPTVITTKQSEKFLRFVMAVFAALSGASAYAVVFPVYTNVTGYLAVVTLSFFIIYGIIGWNIEPKWPVKESFIIAAFILILLISFSFFIPRKVQREWGLDLRFYAEKHAQDRANQRELTKQIQAGNQEIVEERQAGIARLLQEKKSITSNERRRALTTEEKRRIVQINSEIKSLHSGAVAEDSVDYSNHMRGFPLGGLALTVLGIAAVGILVITRK
jgi:hypothetical protein